jgi:DNA-binding transcriptional LysR family regulator
MSTHLNVAVIGELDPGFEPHIATNAAIAAMVADGLGVTIMPELCLPAVNGAIRALDLEPEEERTILLGLPADSAPLPAARAFVEVATAGP